MCCSIICFQVGTADYVIGIQKYTRAVFVCHGEFFSSSVREAFLSSGEILKMLIMVKVYHAKLFYTILYKFLDFQKGIHSKASSIAESCCTQSKCRWFMKCSFLRLYGYIVFFALPLFFSKNFF